jgi:acetyltransferase
MESAQGETAMSAYPADCEEELELHGVRLLIRPIRSTDLDEELRFVRGLSPESAYHRFFSPVHDISLQMAQKFTEVDYESSMAFIALAALPRAGSIVGVARYIAKPDPAQCEFAVTIADEWQHRGLGLALMQRLIAYARRRGFLLMEGSVMQDNAGMRGLGMRLGFTAHTDPEDPATVTLRLALGAKGAPNVSHATTPANATNATNATNLP